MYLSKFLHKAKSIFFFGFGPKGVPSPLTGNIRPKVGIPTTLLAQVDSAIGGKTGVNASYGKNLIGSFYQPKLVISDTDFINSLPKKEMVCGFAEILNMIKTKIWAYLVY